MHGNEHIFYSVTHVLCKHDLLLPVTVVVISCWRSPHIKLDSNQWAAVISSTRSRLAANRQVMECTRGWVGGGGFGERCVCLCTCGTDCSWLEQSEIHWMRVIKGIPTFISLWVLDWLVYTSFKGCGKLCSLCMWLVGVNTVWNIFPVH